MVIGIILAGGKSTRIGENKLLLELFNLPLIKHTITSIEPFVNKIVIVTGRYHEELSNALKGYDIIYNKDYEKGMFSSVLAGVKKVDGDFLILPGDCPFVKEETYIKLLNASGLLRVPTYKGKHGHPLYFNSSLKEKLLSEDINSSLKAFRDKIGYVEVEVDDENILNDIDTFKDYEKLVETRK